MQDMPEPVLGPGGLSSKVRQQASQFGQQNDSMSDAPEPVLSKLDTKKASSPVRKSAFAVKPLENSEEDIEPLPMIVEKKQKSPLKKAVKVSTKTSPVKQRKQLTTVTPVKSPAKKSPIKLLSGIKTGSPPKRLVKGKRVSIGSSANEDISPVREKKK